MIEVKRQKKTYFIMRKDATYRITNRENKWIGVVLDDQRECNSYHVDVKTVYIGRQRDKIGNIYPVDEAYLIPVPYPTWQPEYDDLP